MAKLKAYEIQPVDLLWHQMRFSFADGLEAAIEAGASSIIQPGGSIKDRGN